MTVPPKDEKYYQAYLNHHRISRRGLFRGMFSPAAAQNSNQNSAQSHQARPPFAAPAHLFFDICSGCGQCEAACPYGLIQIQQGKAAFQVDFSACDFCQACANACPTQALHIAFPADTHWRPQFLENCLQKQGQPCQQCQQDCPKQAILSDLQLDTERCNGCGQCQISCFVQAIRLKLQNWERNL
ncbi:ferredoxin-type protein NapF [Necropsobacter massiliensis]|uniref:ferredoxin-type protein NapF n=1 Tax=Necropsobacter massiliensis TaxID=1400001 RepID=UPI000595A10C|nr:ferredoxin-type protein NapF [Necropsobacter massiliensis]